MMKKFALSKVSRFFLAFALTLGMLISAIGVSVSHLPVNAQLAKQALHAELAPSIDDHGHSHDDGEIEEQNIDHNRDHNPADHSHETPHLISHVYAVSRGMARINFVAIPASNELGAFFRLDRPPKTVSLV